MKIETGKKFEIEIDGLGTVMDYVEDRFIFVIKDAFWNDIELQMARKGLLEIDFVYYSWIYSDNTNLYPNLQFLEY